MVTFWPRVNTVLLLVLLLAVIGFFATRAFGGPLDPPGPPASTPGGIDGRIPIDHLPFTTAASGSFVVTKNLSAGAGQSGITICCSNTTVDLGGFTLFGAGAGMSPGDGIYNPGARNVVIRNGAVRGWTNGINLGGTYSRVEGVYATANTNDGIIVGPGSEVSDCNASLNGQYGINVSNVVVRRCTVSENASSGISISGDRTLVEDNRVAGNPGAQGIYITGNYNTVRDNELSGNSTDIYNNNVFAGTGNVLMGNVYCTAAGPGLYYVGNVDRTEAC